MTEILDIVCEREEMDYMDADGWINEERKKRNKDDKWSRPSYDRCVGLHIKSLWHHLHLEAWGGKTHYAYVDNSRTL